MLYILFLILPLLLYAVFARIIIFHLKRYSINENVTNKITSAFIAISLALVVFTALAFSAIPWNSLKLDDIKKAINSFTGQSQSQDINIKF